MKNILIVSNNDMCRSRMAQEILNSFGRGMKVSTAGILAGNSVLDVVCQVMEQNGYDFSRRKPCDVATYAQQTWDYVITLCPEAAQGRESASAYGAFMRGSAKGNAGGSEKIRFFQLYRSLSGRHSCRR